MSGCGLWLHEQSRFIKVRGNTHADKTFKIRQKFFKHGYATNVVHCSFYHGHVILSSHLTVLGNFYSNTFSTHVLTKQIVKS